MNISEIHCIKMEANHENGSPLFLPTGKRERKESEQKFHAAAFRHIRRRHSFHLDRASGRDSDHHYSIDIKLMSIGKYATYI